MAYRQRYNTRFSGDYNVPGQFVPASEPIPQTQSDQNPQEPEPAETTDTDVKMESDSVSVSVASEDEFKRPYWMKSKLPGVKKVSNRERRRRQNESLRRLLTPKNALMVLNEMMPNEQVTNQFKVEAAVNNPYHSFKSPNMRSFCADLTLDGQVYKGFGENKMMARNAAAEQAIRDLIIKKMHKTINSDTGSLNGSEELNEDALPMIQLASFALHKLFSEWEYEGHKVPQLKPTPEADPSPKKTKSVPQNASQMHPCMLLTYMRPNAEYREVTSHGERHNMVFTVAVHVDNATYVGKAHSKKEARKIAASEACHALFNVQFDPTPTATTPVTNN